MPDFSPSDTQSIIDTADRLQIDPQTLAATLHYESNFKPRATGPSGKGYPVRGLIGFDPENVRRYGEPGATIAAQMPQVEQYLLDRGWKPGQFAPNDLGRLYSIINAGGLDKNGQPYWNRRDTNGSIAEHVERIRRGSMGPAEQFLAQSDPMGAINAAIGAAPSAAPTGMSGKLFKDAGFDVPGAAASAPAAAPAGASAPESELRKMVRASVAKNKGKFSNDDLNDIVTNPDNQFKTDKGGFAFGEQLTRTPLKDVITQEEGRYARGEIGPPAGTTAAKPRSIFEDAGFTLPTGKPATPPPPAPMEGAPPGATNYVQMPGGGRNYIDAKGNFIPPSPNPPEEPRFVPGAGSAAVGRAIAEEFTSSAQQAKQGWEGILSGRSATGLGNVAMGGLGMISSPLSGLINAAVKEPVTQLTGRPEAGERAAFVAGSLPALGGSRAAVRAASPTNRALDTLVNTIGPENVPEVAARLRANPNLTLADASENVRTLTQGLAADPAQPEAYRAVRDAVSQRAAEAPAQVNSAYTQAMGPAPDVMGMLDWLKNRAREAGRTQIEPALRGAKPVDTSPVVKAIDDIVKPGLDAMLDPKTRLPLSPLQQELLRFKQQLVSPGETLTDAGRLHDVQSRLGDMAYQLTKSADGKDRYLGSQLRSVNEKLIDQIDTASGGTYRPARQKFKDAKDIHQAWEEGFDVLKNRSGVAGLEDRPEALAKWMQTATPEEITAKKLGVRADIDQKIRGVRNQVQAGANITKIEYNREKLKTLFGDQEAGRLTRAMDDAADMAQTNAKLVGGSKTAETLTGQQALAVRSVGGGNPLQYALPVMAEILGEGQGLPGVGLAGVTAAKLGHMGWQKVGQLSDRARNAAFARAAMARGQDREGVLSALGSHPQVIRELQKRYGVLTAPPGGVGPFLGGASALLGGAATIERLATPNSSGRQYQ